MKRILLFLPLILFISLILAVGLYTYNNSKQNNIQIIEIAKGTTRN